MITKDQLDQLAKRKKINQTTIFREYLQILFLSHLYSDSASKRIYFKGGTAIHLIFGAPRFSEDLDFTVEEREVNFTPFIGKIFKKIQDEGQIMIKEKKSIAGKSFLLTAQPSILPHQTFVKLDFSFRERVLYPQQSTITTDYPIIFTSYVYHLSKEEIFAEKIRALMTRKKGRDIYDLWYLATQEVRVNNDLIREKLKYYKLDQITNKAILEKIRQLGVKEFVSDIRPFVPIAERDDLPEFFAYIQKFLEEKLTV